LTIEIQKKFMTNFTVDANITNNIINKYNIRA
jgi:hypothetical protein